MENVIWSYEHLEKENGSGDLTEAEWRTIGAFLMTIEQESRTPRYLEVGVFGGTTIKKLKSITSTTQFVGVDLFEDFVIVDDNTHKSGTYRCDDVRRFLGNRVELIKGNSDDVLPAMHKADHSNKFDFIFIDGNHAYNATVRDYDNTQPLLKKGGYIAFHNCSAHIWPDYLYIQADGGPWLATQQIKASAGVHVRLAAEVERICVFQLI